MSEPQNIFTSRTAGEAFMVDPPGGQSGAGVLVLHSWWGLNDWTKDFSRRIAALGYTVVAPDLFEGEHPATAEEAEAVLGRQSPDTMSGLVVSSATTLRAVSKRPNDRVAVVGLSMGASLAMWLAARAPLEVSAVVSFYGAQSIDFDNADAAFQGHYGDSDHMVSEEDRVVTESFIRLGDNTTDFHVYAGAKHWFMEEGATYDPGAAEAAFARMAQFLARHLER